MNARESFAFEPALSGKSYLRLIHQLQSDAWTVNLIYLWLPSPLHCIQRVRERVLSGGHNIPADVIERRYYRSIHRLLFDYAECCDLTVCFDFWLPNPVCIFTQQRTKRHIHSADRYELMTMQIRP